MIPIADFKVCRMFTLNVSEWYRDPEFLAAIENNPVMTWHVKGQAPSEYSDTLLWVDPSLNGEGAEEGDIPEKYWDLVIDTLKSNGVPPSCGMHILVRLTNLESDQ